MAHWLASCRRRLLNPHWRYLTSHGLNVLWAHAPELHAAHLREQAVFFRNDTRAALALSNLEQAHRYELFAEAVEQRQPQPEFRGYGQ